MSMYSSSASSSLSLSSRHCIRGSSVILLFLIISVAVLLPPAKAEYFSSIDKLQQLVDIELELVNLFRAHLEREAEEFASYRKFIEHIKLQHKLALEDVEDYLGNPINAFTLIKRMVVDWHHLHNLVMESESQRELREQLESYAKTVDIPDDDELYGAVNGLARLQTVYQLDSYDLAEGKLNGVDYGVQLAWQECFEIATNLYDDNQFPLAITWFDVTLDKLKNETNAVTRKKFKINALEYLALAQYELDEVDAAIASLEAILEMQPDHSVRETKTFILATKANLPVQYTHIFKWQSNYTRLCRGEQIPEKVHHTLKCQVETRNRPEFVLAPLKVEQLSLDPQVLLYHGLLNDEQIKKILSVAQDKMERSTVVATEGNAVQNIRVSQQSWLSYTEPTIKMIRRLVSQIGNLNTSNTEELQVANYGIGGHYEPHYDFVGPAYEDDRWEGDRIATHMFYLSDVEQGGYTVFPYINLFLPPIKGGMVEWFNYHKSINEDYRTLHAGCPVLKGSKRIANVWTHSGYQEFLRPCALVDDSYNSMVYRDF